MDAPGNMIAAGRDADIFEYGNGKVLRRSRDGRSQVLEARVMDFVRSKGYPVPEVIEVSDDGIDLVMARITGPTMIEVASTQPWNIKGFGRDLAELHESLHLLSAPDWIPNAPCGLGERVLHMDLHPLNIIISNKGPVVIDWTNAVRGNPMVDVAATWVLLACANVPGGRLQSAMAKFGRGILLRSFLSSFPETDLALVLKDVVEWKCGDNNMIAAEIERMRSLL
jgi:tRNA A-37 threonylcarbamoyl transferase component Bud32